MLLILGLQDSKIDKYGSQYRVSMTSKQQNFQVWDHDCFAKVEDQIVGKFVLAHLSP